MRRWVAPMNTTVNVSGRLEHRLDDDAQAAFDDKLTDDSANGMIIMLGMASPALLFTAAPAMPVASGSARKSSAPMYAAAAAI